MCPYRKPTQVDEERILRPAEEVSVALYGISNIHFNFICVIVLDDDCAVI